MKILLVKNEGWAPLKLKDEHLSKIRKIDSKIDLLVVPSDDSKEIQKQLIDADILAVNHANFPSIKKARKLKWIQSFSAGLNKILVPDIINSDILVSSLAGVQDISIAEHVLGFMLIFSRRFYETFKNQKQKKWQKSQRIHELRGKKILIVGLGNVGMEIARISNCLGLEVFGIKKNIKLKPKFVKNVYALDQIEKILPIADFVVLSLPLTDNTYHLFDMKKFRVMKKSAVIINIGRGAIINEKDLINALNKKVIEGAALDVTEIEPLPTNSPLWNMENVVITPHHSGPTDIFMDRAIDIFCLNLKAYLKGKPLPNLVDKKRGY